jgi:hypothetical protein
MELLDFKYWITLNESQKSYYTFEIPKRELTEIDEVYDQELREILKGLPESMYEISEGRGPFTLTLHSSQDEILSSVYGESQDVVINLVHPASSNSQAGPFKKISYTNLFTQLRGSVYPNKFTHRDDSVQIRYSLQLTTDLDMLLNTTAQKTAVPFSAYNHQFIRPTASEFFELIYSSDESKVSALTKQLNEYLRYFAVKSVLPKYLESESTPNLEEINKQVTDRLQRIKSLEPDEKLKETLAFQKEILSQSSKSDIESPIMTNVMIENFRILLSEVGTVKEIKKRLA